MNTCISPPTVWAARFGRLSSHQMNKSIGTAGAHESYPIRVQMFPMSYIGCIQGLVPSIMLCQNVLNVSAMANRFVAHPVKNP